MDWKEFLKPDWRKILLLLLPIIFLIVIYGLSWAINSDEWKINDNPVNYIIFHFPCFIEKRLFCSTNCCFASALTQVASCIIFYLPWFVFSWFIAWANDKVDLRGYLWRRIHEKETPNEEVKTTQETPIENSEIIKKKQSLLEEEKRLKQEREEIYKTIDELNVRKLLEIGLDVNQSRIRCSNCIAWESINNKNLSKMIKRHGIDILWKYKCKNCKKKKH